MMTIKKQADKCTVKLEGELDIYAATTFKNELLPVLEENNSFVFDLSSVIEIDTSCLQLLIQAKRECEKTNKEMRMVSHSPTIIEALDLYGLEGFFGDQITKSSADEADATLKHNA